MTRKSSDDDGAPATMVVEHVDPRLLKPDPNNPRQRIDSARVTELAVSMGPAGVVQPLMVDPDNIVVLGERRRRAALEAKLTTVPVYRHPSLTREERLLLQAIENLQRADLSEAELQALVPRLLEYERKGLLGPDPRGLLFPQETKGHRQRELGVRSLAARLGKSPKWVSTYSGVKDVPERLVPLVTSSNLSRRAALDVESRCPAEHREQLVSKLEMIAPRAFIETGAVGAVLDGLDVAGDNDDVARDVLNCLAIGATEAKTVKAGVQVALARMPELKRKTEADDARRLADAMTDLRRRLTPECAARLGTFTHLVSAAELLDNALDEWRRAARHASVPTPRSAPASVPTPTDDFIITPELAELDRQALEVVVARTHAYSKATRADVLADAFRVHPTRVYDVLRSLAGRDMIREQDLKVRANYVVKDEDRVWYAAKKRRYLFAEGACVPVPRAVSVGLFARPEAPR